MDSEMNISRLLLLFLRILQCLSSLIVIITEILRNTHILYLIEWEKNMKVKENKYELFFEYFVMSLGFATSAFYIFRFNQRWRQPYKCDIFIDCILMNSWMIFGILRLSPQFDDADLLKCSRYDAVKRRGCITYVTTLALAYFISASYFLTAMVSTWIRAEKNSLVNSTNNPTNHLTTNNNNNSFHSSKSSFNRSESNGRNSQIINNIHLAHEFNRTDGTIVILRKPTPPFFRHGSSSRNSSLYENSLDSNKRKYMSEYSLDSSFSRTYGSIIIPRKYLPNSSQSETDTNTSSTTSKRDGSIIIGRNQIISTYTSNSENSSKRLSSAYSEKTSISSKYDGSIIIKFVA